MSYKNYVNKAEQKNVCLKPVIGKEFRVEEKNKITISENRFRKVSKIKWKYLLKIMVMLFLW